MKTAYLGVFLFVLAVCRAQDDELQGKDFEELNPQDMIRNREHLKHHMDEIGSSRNVDEMTNEELEFNFFTAHDFDKNFNLDGLEIYAAIAHRYEEHYDKLVKDGRSSRSEEQKTRLLKRLGTVVERATDMVMDEDDTNKDGYLTYQEFASATRMNKIFQLKLN